MNLRYPSPLTSGRTLFALGQHGLCARVVICDWYRNAFAGVAEQADKLETAYIARASRGVEPLSNRYPNPTDLRQDDAVVLVFDAASGAAMLIHEQEIVDIDQRLYDDFGSQFKTVLNQSMFVKTALANAQISASEVLFAIPHIAGSLAALVEKAERLMALSMENRNCTDRQHLFVRATLGKKIAVELAQEFGGFRYQLLQHRSRASMSLLQLSSGVLKATDYDKQFGATDEHFCLQFELDAVALLEKLTAEVRLPLLELTESFQLADIPLAEFDTLTKRLEPVQDVNA